MVRGNHMAADGLGELTNRPSLMSHTQKPQVLTDSLELAVVLGPG